MVVFISTSDIYKACERLDDFCWRIPRTFRADMRVEARIFASQTLLAAIAHDLSLLQCVNVATLPGIVDAAIALPDIHQGYGFPIGGVAAIDPADGVVSPGGVGFDINCGVRLLLTNLTESVVRPQLSELVRALAASVPAGAGAEGPLSLEVSDLESVMTLGLRWFLERGYASDDDLRRCEAGGCLGGADPDKVSLRAKVRGRRQLGTLGAGNHFLEVQKVDEIFDPAIAKAFGLSVGQVVVMLHSGSRGLGHQVASDYIQLMGPVMERENIRVPDRQLACAPVNSSEGRDYLAAMAAASNFAWGNRQMLTFRVRQVFRHMFDTEMRTLYDVAHNIAKLEWHGVGSACRQLLVHRKGATRAFPPGHPELPGDFQSYGQPVLVPGDMGRASYVMAGLPGSLLRTFGSVCHGAGRAISRTEARRSQNFYEVEARLTAAGIVVRGASRAGITEEAPEAYKNIEDVTQVIARAGLAKRVARLRPMGVVKG